MTQFNNKVWIRSGLCWSNFAEDALAGDNSSTGARRSAGWTPKPKASYHKAAKSQEPLLLRQLRRVHRRLVEFIRHPHQDDLKRVLRKNMQMLQAKIPQLIGNINADAEELATIPQNAIAEKERRCIQEHRTVWKTSLQDVASNSPNGSADERRQSEQRLL